MKIFISLFLVFISFFVSHAQQIKYNDGGFSINVESQKEGLKYIGKEYIISENMDSIAYYPFFFAYNEISESNAELIYESAKTTLKIEAQGKIRGVNIAKVLVPANLSNFQLNIKFSRKLEVKSASEQQKNLFAIASNIKHINALQEIEKAINSKNAQFQSKNIWYDSKRNYVKISTKKNGIAEVSLNRIFQFLPESISGNPENFHLVYKGLEYPYIVEGNSLFFYGRQAHTDTTYLDHYSDVETFFLYYDATQKGKLLSKNSYAAIDKVPTENTVSFKQRIESDREYAHGRNILITETSENEGWYWDMLWEKDNLGSKFSSAYSFMNYGFTSNIKIKIEYATFNWAEKIFAKFGWNLNGTDTAITTHDGYIRSSFEKDINPNELLFGENRFNLYNFKRFENLSPNSDTSFSYLCFDAYEISGNIEPVVFNDKIEFSLDKKSYNYNLDLNGFSSSKVYLIDTLNSSFAVIDAKSNGIKVQSSASDRVLSLAIGDTTIYAEKKGILVQHKNINTKLFTSKFFANQNEATSYLNSIPKSDLLLISINMNEKINSSLQNAINAFGFNKISSQVANSNYIACSNGGVSIFEELQNGTIAKRAEFIEQEASEFAYSIGISVQSKQWFSLAGENSTEKAQISLVNKSNLRNFNNQAEILVLTHKSLIPSAEKYANYRNAKGRVTKVIDVEDVYKEFGDGKKSPHSIKRFLEYATSSWQEPKPVYNILLGEASWDIRKKLPTSFVDDLVPTFGLMVSDYWYSLFNDDEFATYGYDYQPDIISSRIPVSSNEEFDAYFDKIVSFESPGYKPWQKRFFYMSGGLTPFEQNKFSFAKYSILTDLASRSFAGDTVSVWKNDASSVSETEGGKIRRIINEGTFWVSFFGHASSGNFDLDGWYSSTLSNKDKYPIFSSISCNTGAFAEPNFKSSRNEDYLLAPNKGFIISMGSTATGSTNDIQLLEKFAYSFYTYVNPRRNIGAIFNYGKASIGTNGFGIYTTYNYNLLGDPLINLPFDTLPEFYYNEQDLTISNLSNELIISEDDGIAKIRGVIYNNGTSLQNEFQEDMPITLRLIRTFNDFADTTFINYTSFLYKNEFEFLLPISEMVGLHKISLELDYEMLYPNFNRKSYILTRSFNVFGKTLLPLEPLAHWNVNFKKPLFRVINPKSEIANYDYEFAISKTKDTIQNQVLITQEDYETKENYIEWEADIELEENQPYYLRVRSINIQSQELSDWLWIPFVATNQEIKNQATFFQNHFSQLSIDSSYNIDIKESENDAFSLGIKKHQIEYYMYSSAANGAPRWVNITFTQDNKEAVIVSDAFKMGYHIVLISKSDINKAKKYRYWNTYEFIDQSPYFINFLRDSISDDDYVFFASCDKAGQKYLGAYLDTVKSLLKNYGARFSDSISEETSYTLFGAKGLAEGKAIEKWSNIDTSSISGTVYVYESEGQFTSKAIGPAENWGKLNLNFASDENSLNKLQIFGIDESGKENFLKELDLINEIDLSEFNDESNSNSYLKFKFLMKRLKIDAEPKINSYSLNYRSYPEFAVLKTKYKQDREEYMRGINANLSYSIENISARFDKIDWRSVILNNNSNEPLDYYANYESSEVKEFDLNIATDAFQLSNSFIFKTRYDAKQKELYSFNDMMQKDIIIYEDSIKPWYEVYLDSVMVKTGDYVQRRPVIDVFLYDNSPLPITDESSIGVRINGWVLQKNINTDIYEFTSLPNSGELKAHLRCQWDSTFNVEGLAGNYNNLRIIAKDASANSADTLTYRLFVSQNGSINDVKTYPNPFSDEVKIQFKYKGPNSGASALLKLYDMQGRELFSERITCNLGNNIVSMYPFTNARSISPGVYFFKIQVDSEPIFIEPYLGRIVYIE